MLLISGCSSASAAGSPAAPFLQPHTPLSEILLPPSALTPSHTPTARATPTPPRLVPAFKHIVMILFENKEFGFVIGNSQMPNFNRLAKENALLTQEFAITHPSLPNYLALIGGDTFGITRKLRGLFHLTPVRWWMKSKTPA